MINALEVIEESLKWWKLSCLVAMLEKNAVMFTVSDLYDTFKRIEEMD